MTTKLQLSHLPNFHGSFSWDYDILIANIRAEKPDYLKHSDPATWPRITTARFSAQLGPLATIRDDLADLPLGLAYDNEIARAFGAQVPADINVDRSERISGWGNMRLRHYLFPFYFGPGGHTYSRRNGEGLAPSTRIQWIVGVTGLRPERTTVASMPRKRRIYSVPSSDSEEDDVPNSQAVPASATQAYREVLAMVDELPGSEHARLQKQVDELERALVKQRNATRNACAGFEEETRTRKDRIAALEQALAEKEAVLEDKDAELRRKSAELEQGRKEISEAKQQVLDIWAAMKAASRPGHELKADNVVSGVATTKGDTADRRCAEGAITTIE